jgi:cytochrome c556
MIVVMSLTACSPGGQAQQMQVAADRASASHQDSPFVVTATIKELMDSTVDPAADDVWESVAVISSKSGVDERKPRSDEDWKAVRRRAMTLVEATNLLVMDGRHAAPEGTQPGTGELAPAEIDRRIAATRPAFVGFAHGLRATAMKALNAIDRKDSEGLLQAGGEIDAACEACHVTYWYPDQKIPAT